MPVSFRRSFKILPGVRLTFHGKTWSVTVGGKRVRRTFGSRGTRTTSVNLPGPFGYRKTTRKQR